MTTPTSALAAEIDRRAQIGGSTAPAARWPWTVPVGRLVTLFDVDGRAPEAIASAAVDRARSTADETGAIALPAFWQAARDVLADRLRTDLDPLLALLFASHRRRVGAPADTSSSSLHDAFFTDLLDDGGSLLWRSAPVGARRLAERVARWEDWVRRLVEGFGRGRGTDLLALGVAADDQLAGIVAPRATSVGVLTAGGVALDHLARPVSADLAWAALLRAFDHPPSSPVVVADPVTGWGWRPRFDRLGPEVGEDGEAMRVAGLLAGVAHGLGGFISSRDLVGSAGATTIDDPAAVLAGFNAFATVLDQPIAHGPWPPDDEVVYEVTDRGTDAMAVRRRPSGPSETGAPTRDRWSRPAREGLLDGFQAAGPELRRVLARPDGRATIDAILATTPRRGLAGGTWMTVVGWTRDRLGHPAALADADVAASRLREAATLVARPDAETLAAAVTREVTAAVSEGATGQPGFRSGVRIHREDIAARISLAVWAEEEALLAIALGVRSGGVHAGARSRLVPATPDRSGLQAERLGDRCVSAAVGIGDRLVEHLSADRPWTRVAIDQQSGEAVAAPMGLSLYDGVSGTVVMLAALAAVTEDPRFARAALDGIDHVERMLATPQRRWEVGGLHGIGGVIYAFAQSGVLLGRPQLVARSLALVAALDAELASPELNGAGDPFDVLGGRAGVVLALLAAADAGMVSDVSSALVAPVVARARELSRRLVVEGEDTGGGGVYWRGRASAPLTGFSHGGSGVAWALSRMREWGGVDVDEVIQRWLVYEDAEYDPEIANWPDRRGLGLPGGALNAWCHGAAGIRMARGAIGQTLGREVPEPDGCVDAVGSGGEADWLCCGHAGRIEAALRGMAVDAPGAPAEGRAAIEHLLARVGRGTVVTLAVPGHEDRAAGLFQGHGGVALALLRAAAPATVPNVLLVTGPG